MESPVPPLPDEFKCKTFQIDAHGVDLLDIAVGQVDDARSRIGDRHKQTFVNQLAQGFPQGASTDRELP
jgi:hypothetical protein